MIARFYQKIGKFMCSIRCKPIHYSTGVIVKTKLRGYWSRLGSSVGVSHLFAAGAAGGYTALPECATGTGGRVEKKAAPL